MVFKKAVNMLHYRETNLYDQFEVNMTFGVQK
jgi:hypothetical protein